MIPTFLACDWRLFQRGSNWEIVLLTAFPEAFAISVKHLKTKGTVKAAALNSVFCFPLDC